MNCRVLLIGIGVLGSLNLAQAQVKPLAQAHAHNDYEHDRPLHDALAHGFCSVEADVYLIEGKLLIAHDRPNVKPDRTLQSLYLDPLRKRARDNGGRIYKGGPAFWLLIDIKSQGAETYAAIHKVLAEYSDVISSVTDGKLDEKAVRVIISGNRAKDKIAADQPRYVGIDGRFSDLESDKPALLLPWISDNWSLHFRWRGEGPIPDAERAKLKSLVKQTHDSGRLLRLWRTPDTAAVWTELSNAGVDLINADDLPGLQKFLQQHARR